MWQGAWRVAQHELRMTWRGLLFTLLFLAYVAFFSSLMLWGHLSDELGGRVKWGLDLAYCTFMPLLGFLLDPTLFRYRRDDTYSRKLAEWQTMPIGVGQIIAGRMLLFIMVLFVNCVLYFVGQYAVLAELRDLLDPGGFVLYFLTWLGYGAAVGVLLIYMELGYSGRVYFIFCVVYVAVIALTTLLLAAFGKNLVFHSLEAAANRNWETAAAMMAIAVMTIGGAGALLHRRINRRSFWT